MPQAVNADQIKNLLKHIDASTDESMKRSVFSQLGCECFLCNHLDHWIDDFKGDVQVFLDSINVQHQSKYWESLTFSADKTNLILTGKIVDKCACSFAECDAPPLSLCNYCCKSFQQNIFESLLGKQVDIIITESYLRGDQRCSTIIQIR